jgi:ATP-dependent protease ClpP protease subunit
MHGITLYNVLRAMPFTLTTHNVGNVDSIGNAVFLAGSKRYACKNATFMFHGVGFDVPPGFRLEEKGLRERLDGVQADQNRIAAVLADRTQITVTEAKDLFLEQRTKDVDYALTHGMIDEVRDPNVPSGGPVVALVFQR